MASIYGALNTARVAIMAQQTGISVTGQNIANVNTPGYSRQLIGMEASPAVSAGGAMIGTGVRLTEIARETDSFITSQLNDSYSRKSYYETNQKVLSNLETYFNESDDGGLSNRINGFFNSFYDLSFNAKGLTERKAVIGKASLMTESMRRLIDDMNNNQANIENEIKVSVSEINVLTSEIAELNKKIHEVESSNIQANDLRDQRDEKIKSLAEFIDIAAYEDTGTNQMLITTTQGRHLVLGQTSFDLETVANGNNDNLVDININDGQGNLTDITSEINSGSVYGLLYMRDTIIPDYKSRLDKLAAGIIREVNRVHTSGYGLDQEYGRNFFDPLSVTARADVDNAGSASISGIVGQQGFVSTDDYEIDITGAGTFTLNNLSTGFASGTFTFSSGSAVDLGIGMQITLTGSASTGDLFTFSSSEDAALTMAMNSEVSDYPNRVAAGKSLLSGDGSNAIEMAELQNSLTFSDNTLLAGSGTVTFQSYYGALVSDVGLESMNSMQSLEHQEAIYRQLFNQRENVSGVSIDEEMINLIKFQQAYNASAKVIVTIEEMLDTLQQAV